MKIRNKGKIVLYVVDGLLFCAGTILTLMHRWPMDKPDEYAPYVMAIAAAAALTIGEAVFIFVIGLIFDGRTKFRRGAGYTLGLALIVTTALAIYQEGKAVTADFVTGRNARTMTQATNSGMDYLYNDKGTINSRAATDVIKNNQKQIGEMMNKQGMPDSTFIYINLACALFCGITGALISPNEQIPRKKGNQMSPEIRATASRKLGFNPPATVTAYEDGHGRGWNLKQGRHYIGYVSKDDVRQSDT